MPAVVFAISLIMNILRRYWFNIAGIFILCGISFCVGWWVKAGAQDPNEALIRAAYRSISSDSIFNQQTGQELSYAAIRGMLGTIDDPYAELIEPEAAKNFSQTFRGQTGVVGLYTTNQDSQVVIAIVFPNSPASRAGLRVGDVLLAVDGKVLDRDADSSETGLLIRGEPGSTVSLQILRDGKELNFELIRNEQEFVSWRMLPDGIGYIYLSAYNKTASLQMKQALTEIMQQEPAGLVWDLRNNEGGDMQAAQEILSYFIIEGPLFTADLNGGRTVKFLAKGDVIAAELPLVVLIDGTTYSASETSAAAIDETGRGITIGSTTYGKGIIQATIPLENGVMLQMTVAKWRSPTGAWHHGTGVEPQITVFDDPLTESDEVLQKAIEKLQAH
jgi:carboxyl-terminal processing protease